MIQNHWHCVNHTEAAQALLTPSTLKYFAVFFQEQSLTSAAKNLGQPSSSLKYHLEKFIEWDLIKQTRTEPRRGKPIKYYQTVAKQFFIPFAHTKEESLLQMMLSLQTPLLEQYCTDFVRAGQQIQPNANQGGMCIQALDYGRHSIDFTATPPPNIEINQNSLKPLWNSWTTIHLTNQQADQFHQELQELWTRVLQEHNQEHQNTRAYILHLGFTPQS
jgi:hypothetical protein